MRISLQPAVVVLMLLAGSLNASFAFEEESELQWGKEVDGCRLAVSPTHPSFRDDQPVQLRMTIKNVGTEEVVIPVADLAYVYRFEVTPPNGKPAPLTLAGENKMTYLGGSRSSKRLEPGKSDEFSIQMLNRYYDITALGEYTVKVHQKVIVTRAGGEREFVEIPSNTLKVVVREYTAEEIEAQHRRESNEE